jgi:thiamine biosynthesis lipoprotein ApbE
MAEALAAIGLASNVLSFLVCSVRFLSRANELYNSPDEVLRETQELKNIVSNVRRMVSDVEYNRQQSSGTVVVDREVVELLLQCKDLSDGMDTILVG